MEQRVRNYSSDSVGSDRVFIEDYPGMLRATDHRKGRVSLWFVFFRHFSEKKSPFYLFNQTGHAPSGVTLFIGGRHAENNHVWTSVAQTKPVARSESSFQAYLLLQATAEAAKQTRYL